ncbi:hypothetical protein EC844_13914 [Acinetobacter calcoaceticus]|uniref:Uncharacterized protein n=1 Tax=Acinetobacter calcoaceticus TaxID=471 RepID=A0A4R1XAG9_ACICA|nr:hypothetical protein EC844_13914 [Acinetobacter calcoaceticus]
MRLDAKSYLLIYLSIVILILMAVCVVMQILLIKKVMFYHGKLLLINENQELVLNSKLSIDMSKIHQLELFWFTIPQHLNWTNVNAKLDLNFAQDLTANSKNPIDLEGGALVKKDNESSHLIRPKKDLVLVKQSIELAQYQSVIAISAENKDIDPVLPQTIFMTESVGVEAEQIVVAAADPVVAEFESFDAAVADPVVAELESLDAAVADPVVAELESLDVAVTDPVVAELESLDVAVADPVIAELESLDVVVADPVVAEVGDFAVAEPVIAVSEAEVLEVVVADPIVEVDVAELLEINAAANCSDMDKAENDETQQLHIELDGAKDPDINRIVDTYQKILDMYQ